MLNGAMLVYKLEELIGLIKTRPELYISCRSINYLKVYMDGYVFALPNEESSIFMSEIDEFRSWLANKFGISTNQSWAQIILFFSPNEIIALEEFFRLFEEFNKRSGAGALKS